MQIPLWDAAKAKFVKVDIWINNAGIGHPETQIWAFTRDQINEVISTNLIGAIYGSVIALKGMREQGFGGIYNMEGLGSSGPIIRGLALYGTSKSALSYFTKSIAKETQGTSILVGGLRPVETVTPWLAKKVLTNSKNGVNIIWLTRFKVLRRFLTAPFHKRKIFD